MFTSKQRAYLKGLAADQNAIMQIGKGGITENLIKTVSDALEARELIKLSVLESSSQTPKQLAEDLSRELEAQVVVVIGRKIVLYRESQDNKTIVLPK